jgi:hypothetical protein
MASKLARVASELLRPLQNRSPVFESSDPFLKHRQHVPFAVAREIRHSIAGFDDIHVAAQPVELRIEILPEIVLHAC